MGPPRRALLRIETGAQGVPPVRRVVGVVLEGFVDDVPGVDVEGFAFEVAGHGPDVVLQVRLRRRVVPGRFESAARRRDIGGGPLVGLVVPEQRVPGDLEAAGIGCADIIVDARRRIGQEGGVRVVDTRAPQGGRLHRVVGRHRVEVLHGHGSDRVFTRHHIGAEIGCVEIGVADEEIVLVDILQRRPIRGIRRALGCQSAVRNHQYGWQSNENALEVKSVEHHSHPFNDSDARVVLRASLTGSDACAPRTAAPASRGRSSAPSPDSLRGWDG